MYDTVTRRNALLVTTLVSFVGACTNVRGDEDPFADDGVQSADGAAGEDAGTTSGGTADSGAATSDDGGDATGGAGDDGPQSPVKFDAGFIPDAPDGTICLAPPPSTCDDRDDDPWHALGLNCPGGPQVAGSIDGDPQALHVHEGNLGTYNPAPFPPREGNKIVILSSGIAQELTVAGLYASTDLAGGIDPPAGTLPAPLLPASVSVADDCATDPNLVGTGDCSNTIEDQWSQGDGEAHDYAEMRFSASVPAGTTSFSYDLAMFSTEYPSWYQSQYNDMYVAWLESEQWTGNVSFDEMGHPISLNAGFLDYKDAPNSHDCPAPCSAPELQGTAMQGHAGTKWLTTTAPVTPGEDIEVVFAVFDLSDGILDTAVILDNFQWGCEGGPPVTIPG